LTETVSALPEIRSAIENPCQANDIPREEKHMNTKPCLIFFVATLALIILSAIIGNILESNGTLGKLDPKTITAVKAYYFALFCVLIFSMVPLLLRYFISMQIKIGNADFFMIQWLQAHERGVVYGFWVFCVIGFCIAVPAAIKGGFFK